ncbi:hypothetical protein POTOM_016737 [Populus tomentosa]|uniref:Transcription factor ILR3-like n=1 Tax=Populus tomentosa TaxID=118781 RepID=A0A8X8CV49_POPTO|nr:hypothetical protein POTOM_016737 [Populus tomentosa]
MVSPNDNANWVFDCGLIEDVPVPGGEQLCLESLDETSNGSIWSSHSFNDTAFLSVEFNNSFENSDGLKEIGLRKRYSGEAWIRFMELGALLDPGRPPKVDKSAILVDAARMVTQLRDESQKLKESNESLQEKIDELKAEKNELRDEKQKLKTEKENLEWQLKALSPPPTYLPHPPPIPAPFSAPGQVVGSKLMPFVGYPGISMWQFMPPAVVDTSQDHVLRPPVA